MRIKNLSAPQLLCLILSLLIAPGTSCAAISAGMQWDVRTTGDDANGGGFTLGASGTDFSLQDAAQVAFTDLVIGVATAELTSAASPFGATSPGNVINVTGGVGCTTGRYAISSVAGSTATMDRSVGVATSTCTGNLGGGLLTIAEANAVNVHGNTVNIKSGTYTFTSKVTVTQNVIWRGFQTAHGDDTGVRPLITTATNSTVLVEPSTAAITDHQLSLININFSNTAATRAAAIAGAASDKNLVNITSAEFDGFQNALDGDNNGVDFFNLSNVLVENSVENGARLKEKGLACSFCTFQNNGGAAVEVRANDVHVNFHNSLLTDNGGGGIVTAVSAAYLFSVVGTTIANNTGDAISFTPNQGAVQASCGVAGSIIYGNSGIGINMQVAQNGITCAGQYNAFGSNGGGNFANIAGTPNQITLTANPFTSATDYTLNSTPGGGVLLKNLPFTWPGGTTSGTISAGGATDVVPFTGAAAIR